MEITEVLLEKYVSGRCTAQERIDVEAYLHGADDTDLLDELLSKQWAQTPDHPDEAIDVAGSLRRFKRKQKQAAQTQPNAVAQPAPHFITIAALLT